MTVTPEFFNVQTVQQTLALLFAHAPLRPMPETCPAAAALGRVLLAAPTSPADLPTFTRSTVDGYAVRAEDTFGASQSLPAYLTCVGTVPMGAAAAVTLQAGQTAAIHTGAMLPPGANAVVMVERTQTIDETEIEVLSPVAPGENLVQIGEDVRQGDKILPAGHRLRPQDIGGLLGVGIISVEVAAAPRIAIVGSGDELVPPDQIPAPGQIRDINSYTLAALMQAAGAQPRIMGIAADTPDALFALARAGLDQAEVLVMTAGSSVGTRDLTRDTINRLGQPGILQHGLAVKPGKPSIIAVCDGKPVIGLPGNPVSAFLVARQILLPVIRRLLGLQETRPVSVRAVLAANIPSTTGREDTVPVRLRDAGGETLAEPIFGKSNLIYTLVNADGLVTVPLNSNGLKAGSPVEVEIF